MMKPAILLLGTVHLGNPDNGDAFNMKVEGLQSERRQKELEVVITCLEEFQPTKIAVEIGKERQSDLDSEFEQYVSGAFALTNYEHHQIGFRLAERMKLTILHAVDWNEQRGDGENPWIWAEKYQPELYQELREIGQKLTGITGEKYKQSSIKDLLLWLNSPATMNSEQEVYMKMVQIGDDQNPVGIQWLSDYWYFRNLMIYRNVVELIESPEDRILLIYGAGHLNLLHRALQDSHVFNIEFVEKYFV